VSGAPRQSGLESYRWQYRQPSDVNSPLARAPSTFHFTTSIQQLVTIDRLALFDRTPLNPRLLPLRKGRGRRNKKGSFSRPPKHQPLGVLVAGGRPSLRWHSLGVQSRWQSACPRVGRCLFELNSWRRPKDVQKFISPQSRLRRAASAVSPDWVNGWRARRNHRQHHIVNPVTGQTSQKLSGHKRAANVLSFFHPTVASSLPVRRIKRFRVWVTVPIACFFASVKAGDGSKRRALGC